VTLDHRPVVTVDLSGVTTLSASGVHALVNARLRNPRLRLVEPGPAVRDAFDAAGVRVDDSGPARIDDSQVHEEQKLTTIERSHDAAEGMERET